LFARFAAIYGPRWISAMSDERIERLAVTEWAPLVAALSDAQIRAAIDAAKASCEWPPSIPIPQARREALPGVELCVGCQAVSEARR